MTDRYSILPDPSSVAANALAIHDREHDVFTPVGANREAASELVRLANIGARAEEHASKKTYACVLDMLKDTGADPELIQGVHDDHVKDQQRAADDRLLLRGFIQNILYLYQSRTAGEPWRSGALAVLGRDGFSRENIPEYDPDGVPVLDDAIRSALVAALGGTPNNHD